MGKNDLLIIFIIFSQILLHCTMVTLGFDGFKQQLNSSKEFYRHNRDCLLQSLEKHMKGIVLKI